ncbi:hypothetical protein BX600DRAFT_518506 [Xylariales sp. PMI_506]|nr:hypothetical protein BX600DRAFT_518506 [Xylariales sp. PMI_506]
MLFKRLFVLATATLAASLSVPRDDLSLEQRSGGGGLSTQDANKIAAQYAQLIGSYTKELADSFLDDSFTDTSDSINVLAGIPLGSVTFPSKAAFEAGQSQLPAIPLVITSINAITSNTIVLRWTQTFGAANQPVAGISILVVTGCKNGKSSSGYKLKTLYTEFNSLTYFTNTGGTVSSS